jgi:hypothetical protein
MEDESVSSVAGDVETPVDVKGKGRPIASATESEAAPGSGAQSTPRLGSTAALQSGAQVPSSASSDVDDSWGGGGEDSPSKEEPPASRTAEPTSGRARNETSETKASTPRNSSEEGTSSSYDMVSAGSSPKLEKKESASTLKKDSAGVNAEEDEDSDWE